LKKPKENRTSKFTVMSATQRGLAHSTRVYRSSCYSVSKVIVSYSVWDWLGASINWCLHVRACM